MPNSRVVGSRAVFIAGGQCTRICSKKHGIRVLQGRPLLSVQWPLAQSQQRGQTGNGVSTKLGESSKECQPVTPQRQERRVASICGCQHQEVRGRRPGAEIAASVEHFGDTEGPEVDGLGAALKRAETAAQGVPVDKPKNVVNHY